MALQYNKNVGPILKAFDIYIQNKQYDSNRSYNHYHPSEFGKCLRKAQYRYYEEQGLIQVEKKIFDPQIQRIFDNGHGMHDRWAKYAEKLNILRGIWQCNNPLCRKFDDNGNFDNTKECSTPRRYGEQENLGVFKPEACVCGSSSFHYREIGVNSEELNIKGNVDMILDFSNLRDDVTGELKSLFHLDTWPQTPIVVDMKTANARNFKKVDYEGPHKEYIIQLNIYSNLLGCDYGVIIYECKDNGKINGFKIPRDPEVFESIKFQSLKMQELAKTEPPQLPPPRPLSKDEYECKNCEFKSNCHASKIWQHKNIDRYRQEFYKNLL